jgi:hypothetical protein
VLDSWRIGFFDFLILRIFDHFFLVSVVAFVVKKYGLVTRFFGRKFGALKILILPSSDRLIFF